LQAKSQRSTYELLGAYRVFALAVAALQLVLVTPPPSTELLSYLTLGILGIYSLARVLLPHYRRFREGYPGLGVDVVVCTLPLFLTGGLSSPFLFYSLCPIIYAALVFHKSIALGSASVISVSLVASLFFPNPSLGDLSFAGIYVIACFLIGILPYTTNLSTYRRLEQDAVLKERKRLARELHDTVAQTLAYVNLKTSLVTDTLAKGNLERSLQELEQIKESLDSTYEEVRQAINALGSPSPETVDFVSALSHQVKEFSRKSGIRSFFSISGGEPKLSPQIADELLHIVGEAMVNARNHARAATVQVGVNNNGNGVEVTVKDDGCGFDPTDYGDSEQTQNHHGITIMKERAESLGGKLVITTTPGSGTEVKVSLPLDGVNHGK
jgi:signal transduction histidine kinase